MHDFHGMLPLSDREFRLLQQLIYREAGIFLGDAKKALVSGRLTRRLRALGLSDFTSYYELVATDRDGERTRMLDSICTNETRFFREPRQFEFLDRTLFPRWKESGRSRRIRVWSAACSTGEEPYSLAMILASHFPVEEGWTVEVLASDLSVKALDAARSGVWSVERAADIPAALRRAFMLRGTGPEEGKMRAHPRLKSLIEFRRINLHDRDYGLPAKFDLIFCRNVLIYFDRQSKEGVIRRLVQQLAPDGHLFLGHAESLIGQTEGLVHAGPAVYTR